MNNWLSQRLWYQALLRPSTNPIPCRKQEVKLRGGQDIVHLFAERSCMALDNRLDPELIVLRFLGARGRAELATLDPANRIPNVNTLVWTMNPPGFGKSTGHRTIERYAKAALFSLDYLTCSFPNAKIWLYGKSIGATLAMHVAAQRFVDGVLLKNIIDVTELAKHKLGIGPLKQLSSFAANTVPLELCSQKWAASMKHPSLFIISKQDRLALPETQEHLHSLCGNASMKLLVQGGHDEPSLSNDDETSYAKSICSLWESSRTILAT